jgi:hypothetical protein
VTEPYRNPYHYRGFRAALSLRDQIACVRALGSVFPQAIVTDVFFNDRFAINAMPLPWIEKERGITVLLAPPSNLDSLERGRQHNCEPQFDLRRSLWFTLQEHQRAKFAFDPPYPNYGDATGHCLNEPAQKQTIAKAMRLIRKNLVKVPYSYMHWVGLDLAQWCLAGGPRRMIDGNSRPPEDWTFPKNNRFYDGLDSVPRGDEGMYE